MERKDVLAPLSVGAKCDVAGLAEKLHFVFAISPHLAIQGLEIHRNRALLVLFRFGVSKLTDFATTLRRLVAVPIGLSLLPKEFTIVIFDVLIDSFSNDLIIDNVRNPS